MDDEMTEEEVWEADVEAGYLTDDDADYLYDDRF